MPLLSIIIPVYNAQNTIKKCLDSILHQTFKDFEVIIINDCSSDDTEKILNEYSDSRIVSIKNEINIGAGSSRNKGVTLSKGEYIGFVDNDDFVDENYFEDAINAIQKKDFDIACSRKLINHKEDRAFYHFAKTKNLDELVFVQKTPPWAKIYKKSFLIKNNLSFSTSRGEDISFAFYCAFNTDKITTFSNSSYHCNIRKNSISRSKTTPKDLEEFNQYINLTDSANTHKNKKYWLDLIYKRSLISYDFLYSNSDKKTKKEVLKKYKEIFKKSPYPNYLIYKIKKKIESLIAVF